MYHFFRLDDRRVLAVGVNPAVDRPLLAVGVFLKNGGPVRPASDPAQQIFLQKTAYRPYGV